MGYQMVFKLNLLGIDSVGGSHVCGQMDVDVNGSSECFVLGFDAHGLLRRTLENPVA